MTAPHRRFRDERRHAIRPLARRNRGVFFLDVLAAVFVLALGSAAFYSLYPVLDRSEKIAREHSIASQLASKMSEHLQLLKTSDLNAETLSGLHLIDEGQYSQPFSFTNIPMDDASLYSPATMLKDGEGTLTLSDLSGGSKKVVIAITWTSASGKSQSFITGTIVGGYK